ncbi:hypothetical protein [Amycolatopsis sp. FDAARGOS 1241]|uniref:hypothetical protein n=1 Tax=Amycolatopsis sp. FDAARGOS 1241 TaxID=2778070 RepID=UPI00194E8DD7|nr:hypothetical protein [Amycolatopsis sp. FDAARGOS 1241]QRP42773.1 hypothetical protein I6J71_25180 [Amycolatopsis sp. FDAARGOS 1241]
MLSWGGIAYGAALSAVLALVLTAAITRERRPGVLVVVGAGTFVAPVAWNAILRTTDATEFFTDAPVPVFPISWQDTGSGVFTLALVALVLGFGPLRAEPGHRTALAALLCGISALLIDIYLY